jgi:hypothetical protein
MGMRARGSGEGDLVQEQKKSKGGGLSLVEIKDCFRSPPKNKNLSTPREN